VAFLVVVVVVCGGFAEDESDDEQGGAGGGEPGTSRSSPVTVIGVKAGTSGGFVRVAGGAGRRAASSGPVAPGPGHRHLR
jgi:hypothetical protein